MNEIYWITRFDAIDNLGFSMVCVGLAASVVFTIVYFIALSEKDDEGVKILNPFRYASYLILSIGVIIEVFSPTTKEAMKFWGVGGTIDYIKSNETAKQLPDKCIMALDKFVDEYMLNTKDGDKKEE